MSWGHDENRYIDHKILSNYKKNNDIPAFDEVVKDCKYQSM